jgi:UV DNA damage endonuclease
MYRMSSDLAPYATHPDMPQFHRMVAESDAELAALGAKARRPGHPAVLPPVAIRGAEQPGPRARRKSVADLSSQAEMLDRMGLGPEAVMVIHVGGLYGDRAEARARWVETWERTLPEHVRRRLVLENDDLRFDAADVLWIHERTGVPLIFDYQHFWCLNLEGLEITDTFRRFMAAGRGRAAEDALLLAAHRAARGEARRPRLAQEGDQADRPGLDRPRRLHQPLRVRDLPAHGTGPRLRRDAGGKAKDLALVKLRADLLRYAPETAARFGLTPAALAEVEQDEAEALEAANEDGVSVVEAAAE